MQAYPPSTLALRPCGRAAHLGKWCLVVASAKYAFPLIAALFVVHAAREGELLRWGLLFASLSEDPFWSLVVVSTTVGVKWRLPSKAWLLALLGLLLFGDVDLIFGGIVWFAQLVYLLKEVVSGALLFADVSFRAHFGLLRTYMCMSPMVDKAGARPAEPLAAAALQQLWLFRGFLACGIAYLRRRRAASDLELDLKSALRSPFRAVLHEDFGSAPAAQRQQPAALQETAAAQPEQEAPKRRLTRSFSFTYVHAADISSAEAQRLQERHWELLEARRALLEESSGIADLVPEALAVEVRRSNLVEDSWNALLKAPSMELLAPGLAVSYVGEPGVDTGGLTRDWFDAMGSALVDGAEDDTSSSPLALGKSSRLLIPRPGPAVADEGRCREMLLAGRFLALGAVHGGRPLPHPLSPLVCKYIVGEPVDMTDVERLDPAFYRERVAPLLRQGGLAEIEAALGEPLTFVAVPTEKRPVPEELHPGGASRVVTEANLPEYLQLLCEAFLCNEIRVELRCLLRGFWDVLPMEALRSAGLGAWDLAALLSGARGLSVGEWRAHCSEEVEEDAESPSGQASRRAVLDWFWEAVDDLGEEQRRMLLRFVTGCGRLPPGGFASLSPPFTVAVSRAGSPFHLPHANTCINRLVLHQYGSPQQLRTKLLQVLGTRDFGFA